MRPELLWWLVSILAAVGQLVLLAEIGRRQELRLQMIWGKADAAWKRMAAHEAENPDLSGWKRSSPYFIGNEVHPDWGEYDDAAMKADRQAMSKFNDEIASHGNGDWVEWRADGTANVWGSTTQIQIINGMSCAIQA